MMFLIPRMLRNGSPGNLHVSGRGKPACGFADYLKTPQDRILLFTLNQKRLTTRSRKIRFDQTRGIQDVSQQSLLALIEHKA